MKIFQPTPELPVRNVETAQRYFHERWGFDIAWHNKAGRIGAICHGDCALFLRETDGDIHPATFWVFADKVDEAYAALLDRGADIIDPISDKPWGTRQFSVRDLNGNVFHFHHENDDWVALAREE